MFFNLPMSWDCFSPKVYGFPSVGQMMNDDVAWCQTHDIRIPFTSHSPIHLRIYHDLSTLPAFSREKKLVSPYQNLVSAKKVWFYLKSSPVQSSSHHAQPRWRPSVRCAPTSTAKVSRASPPRPTAPMRRALLAPRWFTGDWNHMAMDRFSPRLVGIKHHKTI